MIDYIKSAELNGMSVEKTRAYFDRFPKSEKRVVVICDKCGVEREVGFYQYSGLCVSCSQKRPEKGKAHSVIMKKLCSTPEYKKMLSENRLRKKKPLPDGEEIKIPKNKECSLFIGAIAEELLAKTFKTVRRMPCGNHGFDIICNKDFKIDVKAATTGHTGHWYFNIRNNTIADYFILIAFENRDELTPSHMWLVLGDVINKYGGITISKSTLHKWSKYEQRLDKVLMCCDAMK